MTDCYFPLSKRINLFIAWMMIPQTLAMGWIATAGQIVLELLGHSLTVEALPSRMVGFLLLFLSVFIVQHFYVSLLNWGNPNKSIYHTGHKFITTANVMAILLFIYPFFTYTQMIVDPNLILILSKLTVACGTLAMAIWAIGFGLIYNSTQNETETSSSQN